VRPRRGRPPTFLVVAGVLIGAAVALPLAYLAIVVGGSLDEALATIWQERTLRLALRSLGLAAAVTAAALALALPLAWLTARTDLPARRLWTVLTLLPLVIPSYIGAYLFVSALGPRGLLAQLVDGPLGVDRLPSIYGLPGAWLTLTLFTYPLALLTIQAALRRLDPQLEEAARGMGRSGWSVYRTVVLPQLVPAIGAGGLLVALYVLHDFGAVSIMRFDSFTRVIYNAYNAGYDRTGAAALASLLVVVMLVLVWVEGRARRRGAYHRSAPGTIRPAPVTRLGRWRWPALALCATVVGLGLVLPVAVLGYWLTQSVAGTPDVAATLTAAGHSLLAAGLAAAIAALCALPVALLSARHPGLLSATVERASYAGYALPGIVVALALVFFGTRVAQPLYQTLAMLVFAWIVLFLPQAIGATRASLLQISPRVEEAARGLGRGPLSVLRTVTAPLAAGGVLAGGALVFLTAVKELPAALILAPIGYDTLATEIWSTTNVSFFERGAFPALALLLVSAAPLYLMSARDR
jgi:iron(III) transport system permease protein